MTADERGVIFKISDSKCFASDFFQIGRYSKINNCSFGNGIQQESTFWRKNLWLKSDLTLFTNSQMNEYRISKSKFIKLKIGGYYNNNTPDKLISFKNIIKNSKTNWCEPEWGFPKGRRKIKEEDIDCAKREFMEETGLLENDFKINYKIKPKIEIINATNNIQYRHIYYIAELNKEKQLFIDKNNVDQFNEIGDIGYYKFETCLDLIRDYNIDKRKILIELNNELNY